MRFLQKDKVDRSILVISDIHLGAGVYINHKRNYLEAFHSDKEFVDFIEYYSTGEFSSRELDLVINGDFFDLLAVPFVPYFDDEFWCEDSALAKLDMILKAHHEIILALGRFLEGKKKRIYFIIGNHDAEMLFPSLQKRLLEELPEKVRDSFIITSNESGEFTPAPGIIIKHGHEYEKAHQFRPYKALVTDEFGKKYFVPPWGSYYVTRIVNKFKEIRPHVDAVRPVKKFILHGLIYDTFFTLRFMIATIYYFIMVRFIHYFWLDKNIKRLWRKLGTELELFQDYETLTQDFMNSRSDLKVLVVGHTHNPVFRSYADGSIFINTGTWTRVYSLDFGKRTEGINLSYALIDLKNDDTDINASLLVWKGKADLPFEEY